MKRRLSDELSDEASELKIVNRFITRSGELPPQGDNITTILFCFVLIYFWGICQLDKKFTTLRFFRTEF